MAGEGKANKRGGGATFFSILFGRGDFFERIIFENFFSQKLHYMYINSCRSTTAT